MLIMPLGELFDRASAQEEFCLLHLFLGTYFSHVSAAVGRPPSSTGRPPNAARLISRAPRNRDIFFASMPRTIKAAKSAEYADGSRNADFPHVFDKADFPSAQGLMPSFAVVITGRCSPRQRYAD